MPCRNGRAAGGSPCRRIQNTGQLCDVLLFGTEHQAAHAGVQPISPDYEVVCARRCVAEGRFDPFSVVGEGRDSDAEAVIDVLAHGFVQDAGEVAPEDLQLAADDFGG